MDYRLCLDELRRRSLLPRDYVAVYAGGSLVRGWGNATSDLDIFVVAPTRWESESAQLDTVALDPNTIPVEGIYVGDRRWDIEYWLESQVDELLGKIAADQLEGSQPAGRRMADAEIGFLQKLSHSVPIDKDDWWEARRRRLAGSPLRTVLALRAMHEMDIYTEDAVGQLAAGDVESAVLSAKMAWLYAVHTLLSSHGEFGESPKWFARRFRAANPPELSFDEYWAAETMRSFDPAAPERWVEEILGLCQRISTELVL